MIYGLGLNPFLGNNLMERVRIFIHGMVQGVSYRAFTRRHAAELGLKGFVRNLPDGRVEAVAEGEEKDIQALIKRLKEGPLAAKVEDLEVVREDYEGMYDSFEILR